VSELYKNSLGSAFARHEWLDNHHAIKSRLRAELIGKLPLHSGDHVLDIGCGTGTWTVLAAERVGIRGNVIGIDADEENLIVAQQRRSVHVLKKAMIFKHSTIETFKTTPESADAILLFNVLSYLPDPRGAIERLLPALKPGGRIFIKDTDLQSDFFWPDPLDLYGKVIASVTSGPTKVIADNYDPFFARKIPAILNSFNAFRVTTLSQSASFFCPLLPEEREYVRTNAEMLVQIASANGAADIASAWFNLFRDDHKNCVFDRDDFIYSMNEFVFQASLA
jgi:ubiquinone/menaquinone biosynthesis C-methylase UbiE